jgi:hypothetical protein
MKKLNFINLPNTSNATLGYTQPPTEMSSRDINKSNVGTRARMVREAENLTAICDAIV